jgi:hypothetical protein
VVLLRASVPGHVQPHKIEGVKLHLSFLAAAVAIAPAAAQAQIPDNTPSPHAATGPIAVVTLDAAHPLRSAKVSGTIEAAGDEVMIDGAGEVTSGPGSTQVVLPRRGTLRVCASTTVKLAADASAPAGETPGLIMALDHGAIEASFATGRNADTVLTPDFRILIGGPGAVEVKVRLGEHGDTCVDNPGADAPYVLVSSVFEEGAYRVQAGQRVMFEHGSLHDVVDNEKEPCGCPPPTAPQGNEFPLAQSEGLAPLAQPAPPASAPAASQTPLAPPMVYKAPQPVAAAPPQPAAKPEQAAEPAPVSSQPASAPPQPAPKKKSGFFHRLGHFFRRFFGAE